MVPVVSTQHCAWCPVRSGWASRRLAPAMVLLWAMPWAEPVWGAEKWPGTEKWPRTEGASRRGAALAQGKVLAGSGSTRSERAVSAPPSRHIPGLEGAAASSCRAGTRGFQTSF